MHAMKMMILAGALSALALPAMAQQNSSNNATGMSSAGAAINQNFEGSPKDQSIDTTPSVIAPGMDAGTNNCAISYSGGASVTGFGLALGATMESEDCNERNWIALMSSRGWDDVAQAYACLHNAKVAMAFEAAGYECPNAATPAERRAANKVVDNNSDVAQHNSVPSYCSDGGFASRETIEKNCPPEQADRLIREQQLIFE